MTPRADDHPLSFPTIARWRQWLRKNHGRGTGAWVLIAKKGTRSGIAYREALEEALCRGWIDGKIRRVDERFFMQWFSPRRPGSVWSLVNRTTVERLAAEGRLQPAGRAKVDEAKATGRWESAYSSRTAPRMRGDVRAGLREGGAWPRWKAASPSRRLMLLSWVEDAKRPVTRARRIAELPGLVIENRLPGFGPA
jgi:uncharacterized protein YdeI (YjbR/CyaY-like superfamily)